jgi:hypothetical protein
MNRILQHWQFSVVVWSKEIPAGLAMRPSDWGHSSLRNDRFLAATAHAPGRKIGKHFCGFAGN